MLFIALIIAACLYVGLYLIWEASQSHLNGPINVLRLLNDMLLTPKADIFFLLRGLLFIIFMYIVTDFIYSAMRRTSKKMAAKSEADSPKVPSKSKPAQRR